MSWLGDAASNTWNTLFGMTSDAWAASAGWTTAAIAAGAAIFAYKQVKEARATREEQAQPNVVIFTEHNAVHWHALELVIKNFGSTQARNIRVEIDPKPLVSPRQKAAETPTVDPWLPGAEPEPALPTELWLPDVIPVLAPWQEWRVLWDVSTRRFKHPDLPSRHDAIVRYEDIRGRKYTEVPPEWWTGGQAAVAAAESDCSNEIGAIIPIDE